MMTVPADSYHLKVIAVNFIDADMSTLVQENDRSPAWKSRFPNASGDYGDSAELLALPSIRKSELIRKEASLSCSCVPPTSEAIDHGFFFGSDLQRRARRSSHLQTQELLEVSALYNI